MRDLMNPIVVLTSGVEHVQDYPPGTIFINVGYIRSKLARKCFAGTLLVSCTGRLPHIISALYFVPLAPLEELTSADMGSFSPQAESGAWSLVLPEQFPFFTVVREDEASARLMTHFGENALDVLIAVNDRASLDALTMKPEWYRPGAHDYVYQDDFEASLAKWTGYDDESRLAEKAEMLALQLDRIPIGKAGAQDFEIWCHRVLQVLFKGRFGPVDHHPNGLAVDRRDIVATNNGNSAFCDRILRDYEARLVVFEVKNTEEVEVDVLRQAFAYTGDSYGSIAFVVSRSTAEDIDECGAWNFRNMHNKGKLIIHLPVAFLLKVLAVVARGEGWCAVDLEFTLLLNKYLTEYGNEPQPRSMKRSRKKMRT